MPTAKPDKDETNMSASRLIGVRRRQLLFAGLALVVALPVLGALTVPRFFPWNVELNNIDAAAGDATLAAETTPTGMQVLTLPPRSKLVGLYELDAESRRFYTSQASYSSERGKFRDIALPAGSFVPKNVPKKLDQYGYTGLLGAAKLSGTDVIAHFESEFKHAGFECVPAEEQFDDRVGMNRQIVAGYRGLPGRPAGHTGHWHVQGISAVVYEDPVLGGYALFELGWSTCR